MDYIDIINNVLRRLREDTVTSVHQNNKSSLVADFVNDAKRLVEEAWDWSALRQDIRVTTGAGTQTYSLVGSQNRASIKDARNLTSSMFMPRRSAAWGRRESLTAVGQGQPTYWTPDGVDSNGDTQIKVWPTPDGAYSIDFNVVQRTADLEEEGDNLLVPHQPVILLARAMTAEERGDNDGEPLSAMYAKAKKSLGDAIQYDAALYNEELIWNAV
jgi:hypothetical protein